MISPELLRRFKIFANFNEKQLNAIAMIAEKEAVKVGEVILDECQEAKSFFVLVSGEVELYFTVKDEYHPEKNKEFPIGDVNPGEPFGISALLDPYVYVSSARAGKPVELIQIDAAKLRSLCAQDKDLAIALMTLVAKAAYERLYDTRVQLAAAWAK